MVAVDSFNVYEQETGMSPSDNSPFAFKEILVETTDTADDTDTIAITLADYGMTAVKTVKGFTHSTSNSVIIVEAPTTSVTAGVLTITVGGSTDNKKRVFLVGGY